MHEAAAILEGVISIKAALEAQSRALLWVMVREDKRYDADIARLVRLAKAADVPVETVDEAAIDAQAQGKTHGGVIAGVGERRFVELDALLSSVGEDEAPLIIMLDGVEDPYNFGQAVRAFYASGAHGLVVRPRNWMSAAGVVARASAGASEWMPTAICETAEAAADFFRARGLVVACADQDRAVSLYAADLRAPLFLLIGGEKRGITRSFAHGADLRVSIPYGRKFGQALDTTSAAAVLAFEIMRQRGKAE